MIGGLLGRLFGAPEAAQKGIEVVTKGIDDIFYTKQEKAEDERTQRKEAANMFIRWMQTTQGQNLARRLIALSITFVWLFMFLTEITLSVIGVWQSDNRWVESSSIIAQSIERMTGAVMLILGFYFASPYLGDIANVALKRFGKTNEESETKVRQG